MLSSVKIWLLPLVLLAIMQTTLAAPPPVGSQTLKVGELTISYPDGMEAQAKELAAAAERILPAKRQQLQQTIKLMDDTRGLAKRMAHMLGQPKAERSLRKCFDEFAARDFNQLIASMLNNWRIYREADLRASGTFSDGPITITISPSGELGGWRCDIKFSHGKSQRSLNGFIPFFVKDDGTYKLPKTTVTIEDYIGDIIDIWISMRVAPIHEACEGYIVNDLKLWHPYTRWFNDGVANWVTYSITTEAVPSAQSIFEKSFLPARDEESRRGKVNLPAWLQEKYGPTVQSKEQEVLTGSYYHFATELIQRCFDGQPPETLGKILKELSKTPNADSMTICQAIATVTERNAGQMLSEYLPDLVKEDIKGHKTEEYRSQAMGEARSGKYAAAVDLLIRVLNAEPLDPASHLCLAWVLRKMGDHRNEAEEEIYIACTLKVKEDHLLLLPDNEDIEAAYIRARINQMCGYTQDARELFNSILKANPDHADAKAALEEMKKH